MLDTIVAIRTLKFSNISPGQQLDGILFENKAEIGLDLNAA